ncbi:carboxylesterase family protein [Diplocarpon rosae]|nr:carboxylesterase family protein [Diplocarpon rosae]
MPMLVQMLLQAALPVLGIALVLSSWFKISIWSIWYAFSSDPQVRISQGLVIGTVLYRQFPSPVEAFMGLPYAQAPIGENRFRHAVPLLVSNNTFLAQKYGRICPGKQLLHGVTAPNSEDCMTVNIFRQKHAAGDEKLPVAVYIHGGAFNRGSSQMHNTASMVAWSESPFIGVSFNYRIGALGFLPSKLTFDEGIVNIGLHDQVFMLQWIQDNIEAFGGDKDDVTIFGLSAGAHSVRPAGFLDKVAAKLYLQIGHHILNYEEGVAPLFHKAIIESGAPTSRAVHPYNAPVHEDQFALFISEAGCSDVPKNTVMSCLRSKPEKSITNASTAVFEKYNPSLRWAFQPVIDHALIRGRPIDTWNSGKWNKIPIMTGHVSNEGTYYVPASSSTSDDFANFWHVLLPHYTPQDLGAIESLYPDPSKHETSIYKETRNMETIGVGPQFKRVEAAYAHYAYVCPVRQTADIASSFQDPPVWLYHWALNQTVKGGANHGDNMYYETFPEDITSMSEAQKEVSGKYHAYVTSFITQSDPNTIQGRYAERPLWEKYESKAERVMTFGQGNDERAGGTGVGVAAQMLGSEWIKKQCAFWWMKSHDTEL